MGIRYQREGLGDFLYPSMAPDSHSHQGHCPEGSVGHFKLDKPKRSPGVPGHWGRQPCRTLPLGGAVLTVSAISHGVSQAWALGEASS